MWNVLPGQVLCFSFLKKPPLPPRARSIYGGKGGGGGGGGASSTSTAPRQLVQSSGGATLSPARP
jgi:hypothetical protein